MNNDIKTTLKWLFGIDNCVIK